MSHENIRRSALDETLSPELSRLVEQLAGTALPATTVSRDELLYRAGWDAAERKLAHRSSSSDRLAGRFTTVGWSAVSALVAMSLTVAVMWHRPSQPTNESIIVRTSEPSTSSPVETAAARTAVEPTAPTEVTIERQVPMFVMPREYDRSATLLIQREQALRYSTLSPGSWNDLRGPGATRTSPARAKPSSARELLQEFLPDVKRDDVT